MKKLLYLLGFLFLFAEFAFAGIPVPPANYSGFRSTLPPNPGIQSTGGYLEENGGFRISWEISFDGSYWTYSYTLRDADGSTVAPDVSHWILEISPEVPFNNITAYIFNSNSTVVTPGGDYWVADPNFPNTTQAGANNGNPNLGSDLTGIKFDTSSNSVSGNYTFMSTEPPVWGDFYIK
jgi:hypothetical protein